MHAFIVALAVSELCLEIAGGTTSSCRGKDIRATIGVVISRSSFGRVFSKF